MAVVVNAAPAAELESTYNALIKYVKQYIESGELRTRFDVFQREDVTEGGGIEVNIILSAAPVLATTGSGNISFTKAAEHGKYNPKVVTLFSTKRSKAQYAVTIDECRLRLCVGDEAKLREYAAELTESLYQGWTDDKNTYVYEALDTLYGAANVSGRGNKELTIPTDGTATEAQLQDYARRAISYIKSCVEDFAEGVTGESYGNEDIATWRIAARSVAIVMSNYTASVLDVYGYANAFNEEYLKTRDITRITTNRMPDFNILITDARNIILHRRCDNLVEIKNSDGSRNVFYNVDYFIDAAIDGKAEAAPYGIAQFPVRALYSMDPVSEPTALNDEVEIPDGGEESAKLNGEEPTAESEH